MEVIRCVVDSRLRGNDRLLSDCLADKPWDELNSDSGRVANTQRLSSKIVAPPFCYSIVAMLKLFRSPTVCSIARRTLLHMSMFNAASGQTVG